jgi:ketosteroid isomerase-like protein
MNLRNRLATILIVFAVLLSTAAAQTAKSGPEQAIATFEQGLAERKVELIEKVVAPDLVVLENGGRNDGWADFRDNHLIPEMAEPAPAAKPELLKLSVKGEMAWAYTRTSFQSTRRGQKREVVIWSAYVLEKREGAWKIVLLDWSVGAHPVG